MSQIIFVLTSTSEEEIRRMLLLLRAGTGFIHEAYLKNDPAKFTRALFARANTLFGELIGKIGATRPELLRLS